MYPETDLNPQCPAWKHADHLLSRFQKHMNFYKTIIQLSQVLFATCHEYLPHFRYSEFFLSKVLQIMKRNT